MIYLKSFFRRIRLKSAMEFGFLFSLMTLIITGKLTMGIASFPVFVGILLGISWFINNLAKKKVTNVQCPLCYFPHSDLLYPARRKRNPSAKRLKGSFACSSFDHAQYPDIYYCPSCHNGFLSNMEKAHCGQTIQEGNQLYKEVEDHEYLQQISARYLTYEHIINKYQHLFEGKNVLEIGCYYGAFYEKVRPYVKSYVGVEPSLHAGRFLRQKYPDLVLHNGLLDEAIEGHSLQKESYDTIVLFDVLEHLPSPRETLSQLHSLLRPGGKIVYSTINIEAAISLVMGPFWPWFMDMHYYYFSDRGYRELFRQSGYEFRQHAHFPYVVSCHYFINKLFSLFFKRTRLFDHPGWKKILSFNLPIKLGDTVLIIGEKKSASDFGSLKTPKSEELKSELGQKNHGHSPCPNEGFDS